MADYRVSIASLVKANRNYRITVYMLLFVILFMGYSLMKVSSNTKVVLMPYSALGSTHNIEVKGDKDYEYMKYISISDVNLLMNFDFKNIDEKVNLIQARFMPDAWEKFEKEFNKQIDFVKSSKITQVFSVSFLKVHDDFVRVHGVLIRYYDDKILSKSNYVIDIKYTYLVPYEYKISSLIVNADDEKKPEEVLKEKLKNKE